jgi:hypothetical protein
MPTRPPITADDHAQAILDFIAAVAASPGSPSSGALLTGALCVALYFAMPELTGKLREAGARIDLTPDGITLQGPTVIRPAPARRPRYEP